MKKTLETLIEKQTAQVMRIDNELSEMEAISDSELTISGHFKHSVHPLVAAREKAVENLINLVMLYNEQD